MRNSRLFFLSGIALLLLTTAWRAQANPITGIYRLTPRGQQTMCLDVKNFTNADGTPVLLWYANKTSNQQWMVEKQGDGSYKIYAFSGKNSLQMLDYAGGIVTSGNPVTTYQDNGTNNQLWYFLSVGSGWYRIVPKNAGISSPQTLGIAGGATAGATATTEIETYNGSVNQLFRLDYAGPTKIYGNPKKGVGGREAQTVAMHCAWYYTWGGDRPADAPSSVEFVPMEWGYYGNANNGSVSWLKQKVAQTGVKNFLAFNEPDHPDQANLSVASALEGYGLMQNLPVPIGSPACADDYSGWMSDFMNQANQRGYRIDFVCIHCYTRNPYDFINYVNGIHDRFGKPVWVTEFGPADWSGTNPVSVQECMDYMRVVVPWLNSQYFVQRYAWYSGSAPGGNWTLSSAGLVNGNGSLSAMGQLYSRM